MPQFKAVLLFQSSPIDKLTCTTKENHTQLPEGSSINIDNKSQQSIEASRDLRK